MDAFLVFGFSRSRLFGLMLVSFRRWSYLASWGLSTRYLFSLFPLRYLRASNASSRFSLVLFSIRLALQLSSTFTGLLNLRFFI